MTKELTISQDYKSRLEELLSAPNSDKLSPNELFRGVDDEFWFWLNTTGYEESPELQAILPSLPDPEIQARFTGSPLMRTSYEIYLLFKRIYEENVGPLSESQGILDFGCGWGRLLRFFLKDVAPDKLWGTDCIPAIIDLCKATNKWSKFMVNDLLPPSDLPSNSFDLIFCYSVFSHSSEFTQLCWLEEFYRIMRPGGILIATTFPKEFMPFFADPDNAKNQYPGAQMAGRVLQQNLNYWLNRYDNGHYCYFPTGGGDNLASEYYGETWIPKGYVSNYWSKFELVDFIREKESSGQNVIVVRKPLNPETVVETDKQVLTSMYQSIVNLVKSKNQEMQDLQAELQVLTRSKTELEAGYAQLQQEKEEANHRWSSQYQQLQQEAQALAETKERMQEQWQASLKEQERLKGALHRFEKDLRALQGTRTVKVARTIGELSQKVRQKIGKKG